MLAIDSLAASRAFGLADVHCSHGRGTWSRPELAQSHALVFARRGAFRRRAGGRAEVIEPNMAYFQCVGDEQQFAHPADGGDRCVSIELSSRLLEALSLHRLPQRAFPTSSVIDWHSRTLVALARHGLAGDDLEEDVVRLVRLAVAGARGEVVRAVPSRRRIVERAREWLVTDPAIGLVDLGAELDCSPDHLSRAFPEVLGVTFTRYRRRLRVRMTLDRITDGETNLARLAATVGFSDHAHLTRSMRSELGMTPTAARQALAHRSGHA